MTAPYCRVPRPGRFEPGVSLEGGRLEASGTLGLLNAAVDARVPVMAEHPGLPASDHRHLMEHPIVLSPLDVG